MNKTKPADSSSSSSSASSTPLAAARLLSQPATSLARLLPGVRVRAGHPYSDPTNYRHPCASMAEYARLLALRFDALRTRHAYYRALRLLHEHFTCDPATLCEAQLTDYLLPQPQASGAAGQDRPTMGLVTRSADTPPLCMSDSPPVCQPPCNDGPVGAAGSPRPSNRHQQAQGLAAFQNRPAATSLVPLPLAPARREAIKPVHAGTQAACSR